MTPPLGNLEATEGSLEASISLVAFLDLEVGGGRGQSCQISIRKIILFSLKKNVVYFSLLNFSV